MYPKLNKIRIKYPCVPPCSVREEACRSLSRLKPLVGPGSRVCIAVGSRGISNIGEIVATTVEAVKSWGGSPFILPAMGSHGGATAEGQTRVLESYGLTGTSMGAPVEASMEVRLAGHVSGVPVCTSVKALESDAVILINRIKSHTDFSGEIESGLLKMAVIGLGNDAGAREIHRQGFRRLPEIILSAGRLVLDCLGKVGGIAILENYSGETCKIVGVAREEMVEREKVLLSEAKKMTPGLPFDYADVLLVDLIGKDISGNGMDTKVVGRTLYPGEDQKPVIKILAALDLTPATGGNAVGIGLADLTTKKLVRKIDFRKTYLNCLVSQGIRAGKIPVTLKNDRELIDTAISYCSESPARLKLARIKDSLHLSELYITDNLLEEIQLSQQNEYDIIKRQCVITFNKRGDIFSF